MLHGREAERAAIDRLLEDAREGTSGVLVLRGEAGIGKSALLEHARAQAGEMRVLAVRGVESEAELAFASLHALLRPLVPLVERLPPPQASALGGALGLAGDRSGDRFLIGVAVLGLLAEAAEERPLLCLVDDAHWLDGPSADALAFAVRRLEAEPVAFLLASRRPSGAADDPGLPSSTLSPLPTAAARAMLEERAGGALAADVADRLLASAGGHPLALAELPAHLTGEQLAGSDALPADLPLGPGLERALLERVHRLDAGAQAMLLLAAAEDRGDVRAVLAAAEGLGLDSAALDAAERSGLVHVRDGTLAFHHPLVRSAVYGSAGPVERRGVHAALAAAVGDGQPDRHAWHLAAAATGPDEAVADALERTADRAAARGGHGAAASALERSAALTADRTARGRRLVAAARAAWLAGRPDAALDGLGRAEGLPRDAVVAADAALVRGMIELQSGEPAAGAARMLEAAAAVEATDARRALDLRVAAIESSSFGGALQGGSAAGLDTGALLEPAATPRERFLGLLLAGLDALQREQLPEAVELLRQAATLGETLDDARLVRLAGIAAVYAGDDARARRAFERSVAAARAVGAIGALPFGLHTLAAAELWAGQPGIAEATALEGLELARATRQENAMALHHAVLARVAALRGRDRECHEHADAALALAVPRGLHFAAATANMGLAELDLSVGRTDEAHDRFDRLVTGPTGYHGYRLLATPGLVEAAARTPAAAGAEPSLRRFEAWAATAGSAWGLPLAARCRALLAAGEEADAGFREALRLHDDHPRPLDRARTALLYGEFLRRERRRTEARVHLRDALHAFEGADAPVWAERARSELRATGETTRRRDPSTVLDLTAQELRIARLVAGGASNRDVASQLFVSPRTVEYHLAKVFGKLGLTSRAQLATLSLAEGESG